MQNVEMITFGLIISMSFCFYSSLACGPGHTVSRDELSKYVELSPYSSNAPEGQYATTAADLSCNFDSSQTCFWRNQQNNDINWQRARLKQSVTKDQMQAIAGRSELPSGDFLAVGTQNALDPNKQGTLVGRVQCQKGNAKLSFDRWQSSEKTDFSVCTRDVGSGNVGNCVDVPRTGDNPFTYNVPQSDKPFDILLSAKSFTQPSFVALDNINYSGEICQGGGGGTAESCSFLNCDFEDQFCKYNNTGIGSVKGVWNRNRGNVGNPALGIRRAPSEYYANVGDTVPDKAASKNSDLSTVYVLESPKFNLKQPASLTFDFFQKAVGPRLEVCTGQGNCKSIKNDVQEEWKNQRIDLSPGLQTISFRARDLKINDFIALDNINVSGVGNDGCVRTTSRK